jgi:ubiquinone/menaquinone biosynthesis C-methylase UbiE
MSDQYSVENAEKFNWSSITGDLNPERVGYLEKYICGKKILDAGCGGGAYVEFLAHKGLEVTGVDKYAQFLDIAKQRGALGNYIQSDLTSLPFPDKHFDFSFCFDVLEHLDDEVAIQELARVTKHRLIIAVPQEDIGLAKFGLVPYPYLDPTHLRYYTKETLTQLVKSVKPSDIEVLAEQFVPLEAFFREMQLPVEAYLPENITVASKFSFANPTLNRVIAKLAKIMLTNLIDFKKLNSIVRDTVEQRSKFKAINLSLMVVINL